MSRKILLLKFNIFLSLILSGQVDTVYTMPNYTTSIILEGDIIGYSIGVSSIYIKKIGNVANIKQNPHKLVPTSLMIMYRHNNTTEYKAVVVSPAPDNIAKPFFYDFRRNKIQQPSRQKAIETHYSKNPNVFETLLQIPDELYSKGISSNNIVVLPRVMRTYRDSLHIKFEIINESALEYKIDIVSCSYVEVFNSGWAFWKEDKEEKKRVVPSLYPREIKISPKSSEYMGFRIKSFNLNDDSYLVVTFSEKNGNRTLELVIDSEFLENTKMLNNE